MGLDNHPKTIAVIAGNIANEFCKDLVDSIKNSLPVNKGYHLVVLPGEVLIKSGKTGAKWQNVAVFNGVYGLARQCEVDGIIIAVGSMGWMVSEEELRSFFKNYDGIPKVLLSSVEKDYVTVNYDNETGIEEAVDYLINVNGVTNICMLGGDDLNPDAKERKEIFCRCMEKNGIPYREEYYEAADMSTHTEIPARRLLDNNPDVQAVFCVNDTSAVGLYNVMKERGLVPGKDLFVFGFDNTRLASEMVPSLTSIGAYGCTMGQKALELLIDMINGKEVDSVKIKTRLYGRQSFPYETYQYNTRELMDIDEEFIYRMFSDCFYRYESNAVRRSAVDLKRLYYEFISRILYAYKNKFMPMEEFEEICRMIDVFFVNGAMKYTDAEKLLECVGKLQNAINIVQKSLAVNSLINRLFLRMKDDCIREICKDNIRQRNDSYANIKRMRDHLLIGMNYAGDKEKAFAAFVKNMHLLSLENGSFYMFEEPVVKEDNEEIIYPEYVYMKCIIKDCEVFVTPSDRQKKRTKDLFRHVVEMSHLDCIAVFPIVFERKTYGLFFCELTEMVYYFGGFIMTTVGMNMKLLEED